MNRYKAARIQPLLADTNFIIDCKMKADIYINFFPEQCKQYPILLFAYYVVNVRLEILRSDEQ